MWIFIQDAFLSVVVDAQQPGHLLVRGRDRGDIERLATKLGLPHTSIRTTPPPADYRYKLSAPQCDVAALLAREVEGIDYTNFKGRVAKTQGHERAHVYHDVWAALLPLQQASARRERSK